MCLFAVFRDKCATERERASERASERERKVHKNIGVAASTNHHIAYAWKKLYALIRHGIN
jgi:hypothetical protein